jgi:hypothetical protein
MKTFEMAKDGSPEEVAMASQRALITFIRKIINDFKQANGGPGLTFEQIEFILDESAKKKPIVITQGQPF